MLRYVNGKRIECELNENIFYDAHFPVQCVLVGILYYLLPLYFSQILGNGIIGCILKCQQTKCLVSEENNFYFLFQSVTL